MNYYRSLLGFTMSLEMVFGSNSYKTVFGIEYLSIGWAVSLHESPTQASCMFRGRYVQPEISNLTNVQLNHTTLPQVRRLFSS